ncbi:MAG: hypothetical protein IID28_06595 [Planctomycetes bacterium]|nr:hypothetical protein [Planctomycetota bacterium]
MQFRDRFGTFAVVTVVAVLIWVWAAMETRDQDVARFRIELVPAAGQVITPREVTARVQMEGSKLALERALQLAARTQVKLTAGNELPSQPGVHLTALLEALEQNEAVIDTGVRLVSVDPIDMEIEIDDLVNVTLSVKPVLPGVELEGAVTVEPAQVVVTLPSRVRERAGDTLQVEARVLQQRLDRLNPGVVSTVTAKLSLSAPLADEQSVTIQPSRATIKFTVKSRIKETTLSTVRIQIAGPPEDHDEYRIEIENPTLADVTIKADGELISQIERNQAVVVAMVHLSQREKERGIDSKAVTCFMALPLGENSPVQARIVDAEVGGTHQVPIVRLKITARAAKPAA